MRFVFALIVFVSAVAGCSAAPLDELGAEFRTLRTRQGHFSGGQWDDALDKWGGRKHQVMLELGKALGDGTHSRNDVIGLMSEPDAVLQPGEYMYGLAYNGGDERVRQLLVYHWRGGHDFLFFTSDGERVFDAGWWAALE